MAECRKQDVTARLAQLRVERASWFAHWQEITAYLLPRNGRYFVTDRNKGDRRHNNLFDNRGIKALNTLSAGMMSGMTSPARPWFKLGLSDADLAKDQEVRIWLDQCTRIIQLIFEKSNTYRALHGMYRELGGFGTAASIISHDYDNVLHHSLLTTGEFFIDQDWKGNTHTIYREFQKTVGALVAEFGPENCSQTVRTLYDRGNLGAWVDVIQAIEPRTARDPGCKDNKNMPYCSVYYEKGNNADTPLRESGFKRFPALCPRWDVAGGDIYGHSPGMEALGDIKQLQQEQLRKSQAIDYMVRPPLALPLSMKGREIDGLPGGISFLDMSTAPGTRNLFQVQLNLDHLLLDIKDVRDRIDASFYADLFLMLSSNTMPNMTATEVAERHEEKLLMLGPVLERLNNELLMPLVETGFDFALEAGILPPPPAALSGVNLNVEFISVLAQAQRAIGTNGIDKLVLSLGQIAALKPEVLDNFDADSYAHVYSDMLGVDPSLILASDKVVLIRQQRAQSQAQAQQSALANQQADTAQKLAAAPTQGGNSTALDDLMNRFTGYGSPSPENYPLT